MTVRECKKCGTAARYADSHCIACAKARSAAIKKANPERNRANSKKYRDNNLEKTRERERAYRAANRDKRNAYAASRYVDKREILNAQSTKWQQENKERHNQYAAAWVKNNPEAKRILRQNYRVRKKGKLSPGLGKRLFALQNGMCPCCNKPLGDDFHLDHILPLSLGGANTDDNIQLLRSTCNQQKHAKHPVDFMQSRGFLL